MHHLMGKIKNTQSSGHTLMTSGRTIAHHRLSPLPLADLFKRLLTPS